MRRTVDLVVATLLAILILPPVLVVALLIMASMGRPVFYRQTRVGLEGRRFTLLKFRTMVNDAVAVARELKFADPLSVLENDPRIPPLGNFLRRSGLDELPQLLNVIRGDMSMIGPRPTTPDQVEHYSRRQWGRLSVRPGLTGWAQVNGRNSISWPERIELDLWYIANHTVALDAKIVLRTAQRLVRPTGVTGEGGANPPFPIPNGSPSTGPLPVSAEPVVSAERERAELGDQSLLTADRPDHDTVPAVQRVGRHRLDHDMADHTGEARGESA